MSSTGSPLPEATTSSDTPGAPDARGETIGQRFDVLARDAAAGAAAG
jgi:hypothetical protein